MKKNILKYIAVFFLFFLEQTTLPAQDLQPFSIHTKAILWEGGWRTFLIRVDNQAGITAKLSVTSPQAERVFDGGEKIYRRFTAPGESKLIYRRVNTR